MSSEYQTNPISSDTFTTLVINQSSGGDGGGGFTETFTDVDILPSQVGSTYSFSLVPSGAVDTQELFTSSLIQTATGDIEVAPGKALLATTVIGTATNADQALLATNLKKSETGVVLQTANNQTGVLTYNPLADNNKVLVVENGNVVFKNYFPTNLKSNVLRGIVNQTGDEQTSYIPYNNATTGDALTINAQGTPEFLPVDKANIISPISDTDRAQTNLVIKYDPLQSQNLGVGWVQYTGYIHGFRFDMKIRQNQQGTNRQIASNWVYQNLNSEVVFDRPTYWNFHTMTRIVCEGGRAQLHNLDYSKTYFLNFPNGGRFGFFDGSPFFFQPHPIELNDLPRPYSGLGTGLITAVQEGRRGYLSDPTDNMTQKGVGRTEWREFFFDHVYIGVQYDETNKNFGSPFMFCVREFDQESIDRDTNNGAVANRSVSDVLQRLQALGNRGITSVQNVLFRRLYTIVNDWSWDRPIACCYGDEGDVRVKLMVGGAFTRTYQRLDGTYSIGNEFAVKHGWRVFEYPLFAPWHSFVEVGESVPYAGYKPLVMKFKPYWFPSGMTCRGAITLSSDGINNPRGIAPELTITFLNKGIDDDFAVDDQETNFAYGLPAPSGGKLTWRVIGKSMVASVGAGTQQFSSYDFEEVIESRHKNAGLIIHGDFDNQYSRITQGWISLEGWKQLRD